MAFSACRLSEVHNHVYEQTDFDFVQGCPSHQSIEASYKSTPPSQRQKICSSGGARKATAKSSPMQAKALPQSESKLPALFLFRLILQEKGLEFIPAHLSRQSQSRAKIIQFNSKERSLAGVERGRTQRECLLAAWSRTSFLCHRQMPNRSFTAYGPVS